MASSGPHVLLALRVGRALAGIPVGLVTMLAGPREDGETMAQRPVTPKECQLGWAAGLEKVFLRLVLQIWPPDTK